MAERIADGQLWIVELDAGLWLCGGGITEDRDEATRFFGPAAADAVIGRLPSEYPDARRVPVGESGR